MKQSSRALDVFKKKSTPYAYLFPTVILMFILLIIPICMVVGYSFFDNVIVNKNPIFVGLDNYRKIFRDDTFWIAVKNTLFFVSVSVIAHLILGMCFAMLLNTKYLGNRTKGIFRVIYVLP